MNSQCHVTHVVWKSAWILIIWLQKEPADLDLHSFQLSLYMHLFTYCFLKSLCMVINKVRDKLCSLCMIGSLGKKKKSLDKYIMATYLSLGKYKILLFPHMTNCLFQVRGLNMKNRYSHIMLIYLISHVL